MTRSKGLLTALALLIVLSSLAVSGCAPALIAGGAVGGYAIAKNTSDTK